MTAGPEANTHSKSLFAKAWNSVLAHHNFFSVTVSMTVSELRRKFLAFSHLTYNVYSIKRLIITYVEKYKETTWLTAFSSLFSLFLINGEKVLFG